VIENVVTSPHTAVGLSTGSNYIFEIESRNEFGYSIASNSVYIYCAYIPEQITSIVTSVNDDTIMISWIAPYNNGVAITSYTIDILRNDGLFSEDLVNCDGSTSEIVSATHCEIPIISLLEDPYNLDLGSSIYAKVSATNYYGTSDMSDAFNGAVMVVLPDAPLNVRDDPDVTTASVIGLTWGEEARRRL
jgi:hypothetical protein